MSSQSGAPSARLALLRLALTALAAVMLWPSAGYSAPLSLADALARAAGRDLTRPAALARTEAAEAAARQAGVRPNPSVGVEVENFAGTGARQLLDASETTLFYQQTFERGGKREARVDAARAEIVLARLRGQVRALDALADVQALWIEAAAAQAAVQVAQDRLAVAERLRGDTARRVAAARDPLFAGERARTGVIQAQLALDQARANAANARAALAVYLGLPEPEASTTGLSVADRPTPMAADLQTVDLALLEAERDAAIARIRVEERRVVQDPTLRAGVRHFSQGGDVAFIVGGTIPLGRYDTNQGNIERARAERLAAEADLAVAEAEREREIARLTARRATTAAEIRRIEAEVLPSARKAVDLVRDGFNRGGEAFTVLEVAEAQRAVIDAETRRIDLLKSFALDGARLDRLAARHASLIANAETR